MICAFIAYTLTLGATIALILVQNRNERKILDWFNKADIEISALKERNLDLEKRVKGMEHDLGQTMIEPEPDMEAR